MGTESAGSTAPSPFITRQPHVMSKLYTYEVLEAERAKLRTQIEESRDRIAHRWDVLTTPPPEANEFQHWVNQGERVFAIYDGAMTGYKLFRRLGNVTSFFKRKKKQK